MRECARTHAPDDVIAFLEAAQASRTISERVPGLLQMGQPTTEIRIAVLTVSDGVTAGTREDLSGALAVQMLAESLATADIASKVVPDDSAQIQAALVEWSGEGYALIVTSGGTGISPRDNTPQATLAVIDYLVPGMAELMRLESFKHTPMAALSRAVVGVRGRTLIVNLPGSPKGVRECLEALLPILPHAFEQLASGAGH